MSWRIGKTRRIICESLSQYWRRNVTICAIDKIKGNSKIDTEKNIDRRGPRQNGTDWHIPDPTTFWLPTTFKGAQVWEFRPLDFYVNKLYQGRRPKDWIFFCLLWRQRLKFAILIFFAPSWVCAKKWSTHAECALKKVYARWVCAKKRSTHAEPAVKMCYACWACGKNVLRMLSMRYISVLSISQIVTIRTKWFKSVK